MRYRIRKFSSFILIFKEFVVKLKEKHEEKCNIVTIHEIGKYYNSKSYDVGFNVEQGKMLMFSKKKSQIL